MKLFAKKPCSFNGKNFIIGEEIPAGYVINPKAQEKMGVIAIADEASLPKIGEIEVPIHAEEGDLILCVTNEELKVFTDILQIGVKTAEDKQKISEMIQNIESVDLLIMLDALDGRKHVKDEAQARAKVLNEGVMPGGDE